jgi:hypothetical protein
MPFAESLLGSILSNVVGLMNVGLECFSNLPLATIEMPIMFPTAILLYLLPPLIIWGMGHYSRRMKMIVGIGVIIVSIGILESLTMMV